MYAQVVDDVAQKTLAHATTLQAAVAEVAGKYGDDKAAAMAVGKEIAKQCAEKGISKVCFDRSGYQYHGRVQVGTLLPINTTQPPFLVSTSICSLGGGMLC